MNFKYFIFSISLLLFSCARSQEQFQPELVGGPCEGCEAVLEYKGKLNATDTLPGFTSAENKLKISGTIYESDGKTPAEGVILYIYHTNGAGVYPTKGDEIGWARRHGYIRGWIKTDKSGAYTFYTLIPGSYPDGREPAHIHPTILEPNGKYYYLSSYFFEGDRSLNREQQKTPSRGGNGVVSLNMSGEIAEIRRDFILGEGIPGYK